MGYAEQEAGPYRQAAQIKDLEEKLAEAQKGVRNAAEINRLLANRNDDLNQKLSIAIEALEQLNEKHGLNYWADICDISKEALEKITK